MPHTVNILLATDSNPDAELITKMLRDEFENIFTSTDPELAVQDFDRCRPNVLLLAFNTLGKAENYYLGLYRLGAGVHQQPHRTLVLCNKDEVWQAYKLCTKQYFDDYILFWPAAHDAPRLPMAIHHAVRALAAHRAGLPSAAELAVQARRIAQLDALLDRNITAGGERIEASSRAVELAEEEISVALDGFSRRLEEAGLPHMRQVADLASLQREFGRVKTEEVQNRFRSLAESVRPVRQWVKDLQQDIAPHLESARTLKAMAGRIRPTVLVVEDHDVQRKVLGKIIEQEQHYDVVFAASGSEALRTLRHRRPDLILMDIMLPDLSGIEVTQRLKAVPQFAAIPVIMITGQSEKNVVVDSLKAGAVDFVVKPFDRETLLKKLRKFLEGEASPFSG